MYDFHYNYIRKKYTDCLLRIGSCLPCVYRVMDARGKFGEHERSVFNYKVLTIHGEGKQRYFRILKRQNQLTIRRTKTLNLVFKIINEKFASSINYDECNVSKQSQKYSMKM